MINWKRYARLFSKKFWSTPKAAVSDGRRYAMTTNKKAKYFTPFHPYPYDGERVTIESGSTIKVSLGPLWTECTSTGKAIK